MHIPSCLRLNFIFPLLLVIGLGVGGSCHTVAAFAECTVTIEDMRDRPNQALVLSCF